MSINMQRIQQIFAGLASFTSVENEITRLAFTQEDIAARDYVIELCKKYDLTVKIDPIGNVFIRRKGVEDNLPVVAFGSHIDTVVNAGKFDGTLGIIAGLETLFQLCEQNVQTRYPLELIIFTCEESSRFNYATLGSKVMCGVADQAALSKLKDKQGLGVEQALSNIGLDFNKVNQAKRNGSEFKCFLELHIEQGPRLENEQKTIGIVTGIAAQFGRLSKSKGKPIIQGQRQCTTATMLCWGLLNLLLN